MDAAAGPAATGVSGGAAQTVTYAAAVKLCDGAGEGCYGFTFESAEPVPDGPVHVSFKQASGKEG